MKVCMIAYSFYRSDARIMQYANALVQRGDRVDVFALGRPGDARREILDGVNVYRIQSRTVNERGRFSYLARIVRFLVLATFAVGRKHLAEPYQFIHVHSVPDFLVFSALLPKLFGAAVTLDIHDILPEFYASKFGIRPTSWQFKILQLVERVSAGVADHIIIANHLWREKLIARGVPGEKCTAIRNYPDPQIFFPRPRKESGGRFVILYPGSLNFHQGLDIAVKAFGRIADQIPDAEFHIYGEGPLLPELERLSKVLQLDGRVRFHHFLPIRDVAEIMAAADLAVVPKRSSSPFGNEAASTKIMEFMALGVPVIVTRTKVDSYYFDSSMVCFFNSECEQALAESILSLHRDRRLREDLVANALHYVERNNWATAKQEYFDLIDSLVHRDGSIRRKSTVVRNSNPEGFRP